MAPEAGQWGVVINFERLGKKGAPPLLVGPFWSAWPYEPAFLSSLCRIESIANSASADALLKGPRDTATSLASKMATSQAYTEFEGGSAVTHSGNIPLPRCGGGSQGGEEGGIHSRRAGELRAGQRCGRGARQGAASAAARRQGHPPRRALPPAAGAVRSGYSVSHSLSSSQRSRLQAHLWHMHSLSSCQRSRLQAHIRYTYSCKG